MCKLYSWIEKDGDVIFLTADDVFSTKQGRLLRNYSERSVDYRGHGAIRFYYGNFVGGDDKECSNFDSPNNFPPSIVKAIKNGKMWGLGFSNEMLAMLTPKAQQIYREKRKVEYENREYVRFGHWITYWEQTEDIFENFEKFECDLFLSLWNKKLNRIKAWR